MSLLEQYKSRNFELTMLAGKPINIEDVVKVHCPKLSEIVEVGEDTYNQYLGICLLDINKLNLEVKDISLYEFLLVNVINDKQFNQLFLNAMSFFLKEQISVFANENYAFFYSSDIEENRLITPDILDCIRYFLKIQNGIAEKENDEFNAQSEEAKRIAEKIRKAREKVNKVKSKNGESFSLSDLVSTFAYYSNTNLLNVWDLDIYQFNNQFKRMQIIEEYEINIQSLMHGADPKKVEVKSLISKLK